MARIFETQNLGTTLSTLGPMVTVYNKLGSRLKELGVRFCFDIDLRTLFSSVSRIFVTPTDKHQPG